MTLPVRNAGDVEVDLDAMVRLSSGGAGGFVFDYYGPSDFKYVTLDLAAGAVIVGHRIGNQWAIDASFAVSISRRRRRRLAVVAQRHGGHGVA